MITVEFMGMPKTGKTTQIDLVEDALEDRKEYKVGTVAESAMKCPLEKDGGLKHDSWCFHETTNKIMEQQLRDDLDYLLVDRGVYDRGVFSEVYNRNGGLTEEQKETQKKYMEMFTDLEDRVVAFMITPEESLSREFQEGGKVMNGDFLDVLYESYDDMISEIEDSKLKVIDGTKDILEIRDEIYEFLEQEDKIAQDKIEESAF